MAFDDENDRIFWGGSPENQESNSNAEWDYPSFDQNELDTGAAVPLSDVSEKESNQDQNTASIETNVDPVWTFPTDQVMWPMKITEEALESMKAQEKAEQEAALASQSVSSQLSEEPISGDNSFNVGNEEWLQNQNPMNENPMDEWNTIWTYSFWEERVKIKRYNTGFMLSVLGILIFGWLAYVVYMFYQYLTYKSLPTVPSDKEKTVNMVSNYYDEFGQKLWLFNLETYKVIYLENELNKVDNLLWDPNLNFNQKKDDLQRSLLRFWNEIVSLKNDTKTLREKMNKEWFFPQELVWILDADNAINSIQRSLISLEVVKFSSAIRVFSLMDDIVKELADNFDYTKTNIKERLNDLIDRWEQDVEYYLNVCYNNPYEPEECNNINDFDRYYKSIKEETDFDTVFFKKLMKYINNQIEYNDMPSFSITFNSFDWKSNSITFSVEVNTTKEDETALFQQGIKSPNIFIISELIKLLKQSTFIVGKAIDAKNIKVAQKVVNVAWRQFNVQNSINTFTLPIQKTTEREIFDFIETYSALQEQWSEEMYDGNDMTWFDMSWFDTIWYDESLINDINFWEVLDEEPISWDSRYTWWVSDEVFQSNIESGTEMIYSWEISEEVFEEDSEGTPGKITKGNEELIADEEMIG